MAPDLPRSSMISCPRMKSGHMANIDMWPRLSLDAIRVRLTKSIKIGHYYSAGRRTREINSGWGRRENASNNDTTGPEDLTTGHSFILAADIDPIAHARKGSSASSDDTWTMLDEDNLSISNSQ